MAAGNLVVRESPAEGKLTPKKKPPATTTGQAGIFSGFGGWHR